MSSRTEGATRWALRLLGPFDLTVSATGEPVPLNGKRERIMLAWLVLSPNFRSSRRKLAALLWDESDDTASLDNLRVCLWSLRKALGDAGHRVISSQGEDIVLDNAAFEVDVLAFRRLATSAEAAELQLAANLYTGDFLDGLSIDSEEFESWRRDEVIRLRDQAIDVLSRLAAQMAKAGNVERAIGAAARIRSLDPLHEPAARQLMRLYADSGRRGAAIQLYWMLADVLKNQLGVQPEAETRNVLATISSSNEPAAPGLRAPGPLPAPVVPNSPAGTTESVGTPTMPPGERTPNWQQRLKWAISAAAGAAVIAMAIWPELPRLGIEQPPGATNAIAPAPSARGISVAVLPFANLSGDANQQFFSDGITEEIAGALARIPNLNVVARISAFQFRNQKRDIVALGRQLHATHVLEGSVRKAGDRVRVAVQLVSTDRDIQIWSEEYDRPATDIFATQEDVARTVAASLRRPLGLGPEENLVNNRPTDTAAYDDFLRAKGLYWQRGQTETKAAAAILENVVIRVPDYAPAWSLLALMYVDIPTRDPAFYSGALNQWGPIVERANQKAQTTAERALELDPKVSEAWLVLAKIQLSQNHYARAEELNTRALSLNPDSADVLINRSQILHDLGYLKQALELSQRAAVIEPYLKNIKWRVAVDLWLNRRPDEAAALLKPLVAGGIPFAGWQLAQVYAGQGRFSEAADALLKTPKGIFLPGTVEAAAGLLQMTSALKSPREIQDLGALDWVYYFAGAPDHTLNWNENVQKIGYWTMVWPFWGDAYADLRKTKRFKAYVRSLGFVDYWRGHGWPDLCHPVGADDFACH